MEGGVGHEVHRAPVGVADDYPGHPDAGRKGFSEDDMLELKNVISRASSASEWADINTRLGF
jgi:hypothetical protein